MVIRRSLIFFFIDSFNFCCHKNGSDLEAIGSLSIMLFVDSCKAAINPNGYDKHLNSLFFFSFFKLQQLS